MWKLKILGIKSLRQSIHISDSGLGIYHNKRLLYGQNIKMKGH